MGNSAAGKDAPRVSPGMKLLALLGALAIVAAAAVALYSIQAARQAADVFARAFVPNTKSSTVLSGAIGQLSNTPKLVVLTADVTAAVLQKNTTTFAGIELGSASVEIKAPAKIQYYVPMKELSVGDFRFDAQEKQLIVSIPRPVLDADFVSVDANPDKISVRTEFGWSPLSIFKGKYTEDEARRHLKEAALFQGGHELVRERAEKEAKQTVAEHLNLVSQNLREGVKLKVEFKQQDKR